MAYEIFDFCSRNISFFENSMTILWNSIFRAFQMFYSGKLSYLFRNFLHSLHNAPKLESFTQLQKYIMVTSDEMIRI